MTLGENVRHFRETTKKTREELAVESGVSYGSLVKIELGQVPDPKVSTVEKLANALGVSVTDLLSSESNHDKSTTGAR